MSRRKIRAMNTSFLSEDDDSDSSSQFFVSESSKTHTEVFLEQPVQQNMQQNRRSKNKHLIFTSTPMTPHAGHQISTNDHYYDGMLLRSGSHIKGVKRLEGRLASETPSTSGGASNMLRSTHQMKHSEGRLASEVASTSKADSNFIRSAHQRKGRSSQIELEDFENQNTNKTVTTVTTTTTTTYEEILNEDAAKKGEHDTNRRSEVMHDWDKISSLDAPSTSKRTSKVDKNYESKLRADELQTEKKQKQQYKLKHFFGLDSDEDFSDVDFTDTHMNKRSQGSHVQQTTTTLTNTLNNRRSWWLLTWFYSLISSAVTTTVTTAGSTGAKTISKSSSVLVGAGRWTVTKITDLLTWVVHHAATLIVWDIEAKRRRNWCFCCCPLLLLLPFLLLGGYYSHVLYEGGRSDLMPIFWSHLSAISPGQSYQPVEPPVVIPATTSSEQVNMTFITQYMQQMFVQMAAKQKDDRPVGMTQEQVEVLVQTLLANQRKAFMAELEDRIKSLKLLVEGDTKSLDVKFSNLDDKFSSSDKSQQALKDQLDQLLATLESSGMDFKKQEAGWLSSHEALRLKLQDLAEEVKSLSSKNAALTAMLSSCCKNSSLIHAEVISILSQLGAHENQLASLLAMINRTDFVERAEMEQVTQQILEQLKVLLADRDVASSNGIPVEVDEMKIKSIIDDALMKFSADRVGMPDFALESAGGSVLSVRCSETFYKQTALVSIFGIPLWYTSNSPRTVIQPNVHPGECWAFKGNSGYLVLQLSHPIQPTAFTMEHIPRTLAPKGDISSAPKEFTVFGLNSESDVQGVNLGNYTYEDSGNPIQLFPIQNLNPGVYQHIELRIRNNHGNKEYTCLYRFRVHGIP
ncbi:SUN domain-containing protein 1-like isoform X2 [Physella acuta]|nr:SUN domain-containing protein 1-like isoform X2 [Physella acuta]